MNIEIKLNDPRFCVGCPCMILGYNDEGGHEKCTLAQWEEPRSAVAYNPKTGQIEDESRHRKLCSGKNGWRYVTLRPQACINKHGE